MIKKRRLSMLFYGVNGNEGFFGFLLRLLAEIAAAMGTYHAHSAFHAITERLYTIAIGCGIALITSLFILPNWSGEYLHKSIISKFEELAKLLQECVDGYFQELDDEDTSRSPNNYLPDNNLEKVWQCISMEDPWAKFTSWEPRHSRYCYPSRQYVHLGVVLRHLGYTSVALRGCLESHIQAPQSIRAVFREPCKLVAKELIKVLVELAETIKNHHQFSPHISDHLHEALEELDAAIKAQPLLFLTSTLIQKNGSGKPTDLFGWQAKTPEHLKDVDGKIISRTTSRNVIACLEFSEALPFAAFVSLLVEMVARLAHVIEAVEELGKFAHFKEFHEKDIEIMVTSESVNPSETGKDPRDSQKLPIKVQCPVTEIKSSTASTSEI
ncbi:hypothetical protein F0562_014622 [Nyssa sinensis]|uniref:Aluminum-activated malate transporter n=1 Tax=Nyssa sinensis TaxID=561372 RepID=A0A5J4ZRJ6_9ASTE|nr:hypothetical protein F0562_014622 [Nyssa sinensis]